MNCNECTIDKLRNTKYRNICKDWFDETTKYKKHPKPTNKTHKKLKQKDREK